MRVIPFATVAQGRHPPPKREAEEAVVTPSDSQRVLFVSALIAFHVSILCHLRKLAEQALQGNVRRGRDRPSASVLPTDIDVDRKT